MVTQRTTPLSASEIVKALELWDIPYGFYAADWATHNRNAVGPWGPVNGFMVHNFASDISDTSSNAYLYRGDPLPVSQGGRALPGPLSQLSIDDLGKVWLIGWGRCNHGGKGWQPNFDRMLYETLPLTGDAPKPGVGTVDMNARTYAVEMLYGAAPTTAQRVTVTRLGAAICHAHGWTAGSVIAHRESSSQRGDPAGFDMGRLRTDVAATIATGPPKPPVLPLPPPAVPASAPDPVPTPAPVASPKPAAPKPPAPTSLANLQVTLDGPIFLSRLKVGRKDGPNQHDISRYQCALWNRMPGALRREFVTAHNLSRAALYDGVYGTVTSRMTSRLYLLIGLPAASTPGAKMMRHLGFTDIRP